MKIDAFKRLSDLNIKYRIYPDKEKKRFRIHFEYKEHFGSGISSMIFCEATDYESLSEEIVSKLTDKIVATNELYEKDSKKRFVRFPWGEYC